MRIIYLIVFFCIIYTSDNHLIAQQLNHKLGEVLVRLNVNYSPEKFTKKFKSLRSEKTLIELVKPISPLQNIYLFRFDNNTVNEYQLLESIKKDKNVITAQFNHIIKLRKLPNDPNLNRQWQWYNTTHPNNDVHMKSAWDITTGGKTATGDDIVVAVIDDGIQYDHEDLHDNLWVNKYEIPGNGIDDDQNGYVDDYHGWNPEEENDSVEITNSFGGHGISVSGMIGAVGNNGVGVTGVNWNVKIMIITYGGLDEASVIQSYEYAYNQRLLYNQTNGQKGAFVVATNSSWGLDQENPADYPLWCGYYDVMGQIGILSCAATTNSKFDVDKVGDMPTACPSEYLIAVTASNNLDSLTFAGYGKKSIDVSAPGDNIYTTSKNSKYTSTSGTSFASPLVAGIVGLLYSVPCENFALYARKYPEKTALAVRDAIFGGVDKIADYKDRIKYQGRVNAFNSLNILVDACQSFIVEEFCLPAINVNVDTTTITDNSAIVNWDLDSTSIRPVVYHYRYRVYDTLNPQDWTVKADRNDTVELKDLLSCTQYEVQIKTVCPFDTSTYTESVIFKTGHNCPISVNDPKKDITQGMVYPNPFNSNMYVRFNTKNATSFVIKTYSIDGRLVGTMKYNTFSQGVQTVPVSYMNDKPNGIYIVSIESATERLMLKAVKE